MAKLLQIMSDALRRLSGQGAVVNAGHELGRASRSVIDLDAQLSRMEGPPRRAA